MKIFSRKILIVFVIFAKNIGCGYKLEPPRRGEAVLTSTHNLSMFWSKNKKKIVYPCIPQFYYIKVGYGGGVFISRTCFPDVLRKVSFLVVKRRNRLLRIFL